MTVPSMPLALVFDTVGPGEWLLIFGLVLIIYGPRRLPEIARTLGRWLTRLQQASDLFRSQLDDLEAEVGTEEMDRPVARLDTLPADVGPAPTPRGGHDGGSDVS